MKRIIIYLGIFVVFVVFLIFEISSIHATRIVTIENEKKVSSQAYINKDQPTAIYIKGNPEPVLRIEDLPKEFPPHIQHPKGARLSDTRFNLVSLSPDAKSIAFSCGFIHEWVGIYELVNKKVHVVDWLFDTPVDHILWSPNSEYFVYTLCGPSENCEVNIIGFKERTAEPYRTSSWHSGVGNFVSIYDLRWSEDSEILEFDIGKFGIKKADQEEVKTVTLKAIEEEEVQEKSKKKKEKETKYKTGPQAYIKKDQPTAIYIKGKAGPVLRIEDLPKEFPDHIQHPKGIGLISKEFKLASLSPDTKNIAFACGTVHEWVGVYELESKKVHVITWLWDTSVNYILWSPNSKYFAYSFVPPRGDRVVAITGFKERTGEPYLCNHWSSLDNYKVYDFKEPECILLENLEWLKDSKTVNFEIHKCKMEDFKLVKVEDAPVDTITLKVIEEETREDPLEVQRAEKTFWEYKLSANEQMVVDLFNDTRTAREIETFEVNLKLSKAIRDEGERIVELDLDAASIEKKLFDFISHFGDKAFLVKESSKEAVLENIRLNENLQKEILHPDNIMLSFCCVEDTLRNFLYLSLYTCKYQISYGPIDVVVPIHEQQGGPISNIIEINGKTNGKYLKYNFYEGTVFPFYYKGEKMITKELETGEDGSFSFDLGFSGYGHERRRLAIFVRNDPEEPYSLVDFFPVWGGIKR